MQLLHSNNHKRRRRRLELDNATHIEQGLSSRVYQVDLRRDLQQLQLDTIFNYDDDGDDDAVEQFRCCCCFADRIRSFCLIVMAAAHRHDVLLFLSRHIPTLSLQLMLFSHRNTSQIPLILSLCTLQYLSVVPVKKVYVSFKRIVVPYSSSHLYFSHKHYLPYSISHKNTMYLTVPLTKTMYLSVCVGTFLQVSNLQNHFYVFTVVEYINTVLKIFSTFLMKRTSPLHRKPNVNIVLGVL